MFSAILILLRMELFSIPYISLISSISDSVNLLSLETISLISNSDISLYLSVNDDSKSEKLELSDERNGS